jgi:hypothetical protein
MPRGGKLTIETGNLIASPNVPNAHDANDAYSYIHSVIDPTVYYGSLMTTDLPSVGLADHATRSFIGDSRIAGWYLDGEWNLGIAYQVSFWRKYFPFFYTTVHYGGASTSFTGAYVAAAPDSGITAANQLITTFKQFFLNNIPSNQRPDQYGFEGYGNNSYNLSNIQSDLATLAATMSTASFSVPYSHIQLMEAGTNQNTASGLSQFYTDLINKTATLGLSGVSIWLSDPNLNTGNCTSGDDTGSCPSTHQNCWALAQNSSSPIPIDGCKSYSGPPQEWHYILTPCPTCNPVVPYCNTAHGDVCINGANGPYIHQCGSNPNYNEQCLFTVGYGPITWRTSTTAGFAVGSAFGAH